MTVHKPKDRRTFRYRFFIHGKKYQGNTGQITLESAREWEVLEQDRIRRQLAGLSIKAEHVPRFSVWASVYLKYLRNRGKVRRIDRVEELLRVVLRFWGAKPSGRDPRHPPIAGEPYHNLTLIDPVRDPEWIERFDDWIRQRKIRVGTDADGDPIYRAPSAQTRLHYMSVMSRMYRVAALPRFRKRTGITRATNPFLEIERDKPGPRQVTVTPAELRAWLLATPPHARLAIAIAALAPKLRKENILSLRWDRSIDPELKYITVEEHKTVGSTKLPMVVAISDPLRRLLKAIRAQSSSPWVISYRGQRVKEIRRAIQQGAKAAGLTYGRDVAGVTFHTIRHTAATLLAEEPGLTEALRAETMGQDIRTTQMYTHLRPEHQRAVVNALAERLEFDAILPEAFGIPRGQPPESGADRAVKNVREQRRTAKNPRSGSGGNSIKNDGPKP